jgi:hypothetical protein
MRNYLLLVATVSVFQVGACTVQSELGDEDVGDGAGGGDGDTSGCIEGPCAEQPDEGDVSNPIDPACAGDDAVNAPQLLVPKWPTLADTVPNECLRGFEMNRLRQHVHTISSAQGSRAITLEIDIATYTASDAIRISAVDGGGNETILVDTCRMRTAQYADPTGGTTRPPEDSIRDFRAQLPAGTKTLKVDHTNASTPTYIRILGLCDFDIQPPPTTTLKSTFFRIVTSR